MQRLSFAARTSGPARFVVSRSFIAPLIACLCLAIVNVDLSEASHLSSEGVRASHIRDLIEDVDQNCTPIVERPPLSASPPESPTQLGLREALETIGKSEVGAWLLQVAADQQVLVCLDHTTELEAHYRSHLQLIGLSSRLSPAGRIAFLAHELAHVPQHPKFSNNRRFSPADMLLLQRLREATAEAVATRILWQLRDQEITAPWHEKLTTAYRDIAIAFEEEVVRSHDADQELAATRSAFHQWFKASWRLEIYDGLMMKTLSRLATASTDAAAASLHLSEEFLFGLDDYADQRFLRDGDRHHLLQDFYVHALPIESRGQIEDVTASVVQSALGTVSSSAKDEPNSAIVPDVKQSNTDRSLIPEPLRNRSGPANTHP
jgi:hypothetical protein